MVWVFQFVSIVRTFFFFCETSRTRWVLQVFCWFGWFSPCLFGIAQKCHDSLNKTLVHLQSSRIKSQSPFVSISEASSREQWAERGSKDRPWMPDTIRAVWVWGSRGHPHFHYRESEHSNFSSNTSVCCHRNVKAPSAGVARVCYRRDSGSISVWFFFPRE